MAPSRWRLLEGKTAAITGGTTGIGRAIALEYIRQGCNVCINHLGLEKDEGHKNSLLKEAAAIKAENVEGENSSKAGDLLEVVGDVTNPETGTILVEKAVEKWGKLDIFVSNAGVFRPAEFLTYGTHPSSDAEKNCLWYLGLTQTSSIRQFESTFTELFTLVRQQQDRW